MNPIRHTISSSYQSGQSEIEVLLPDALAGDRLYPTLYVLPALTVEDQSIGNGLQEIQRLGLHNRYGLICVRPVFNAIPWYADHPHDPGLRQESHFVKAVVPFVERALPVARDAGQRWLVGFSKSGWGAWSLLLRHPDHFGKAATFDAPLMHDKPDRWNMQDVIATQENFERYRITTLLEQNAGRLRAKNRLILLGHGNFRDHVTRAHELMTHLGIRHEYVDGPQRAHRWDSGWLADAVRLLVNGQCISPIPQQPSEVLEKT